MREADAVLAGAFSRTFTTSSGHTQLAWRYHRDGLELAKGTITWPGETQSAENDYLVELLQITEKTQ